MHFVNESSHKYSCRNMCVVFAFNDREGKIENTVLNLNDSSVQDIVKMKELACFIGIENSKHLHCGLLPLN